MIQMMGLLQENNHGTQRIIVEAVFLALDYVAVGLRLWARRLKRKSLEFNDYAILTALVTRPESAHGAFVEIL